LTQAYQALTFMTLTLCDLGLYTSSTISSILCVNLGYAEKSDDNHATEAF
jgi:hypothetical protein